MLSIAAPLALSSLGRQSKEANLNAGGLVSLLSNQKNDILNMLPVGLSSLATTLGFGKTSNSVSVITEKTRRTLSATDDYAKETVKKGGGFKFLIPLFLLAASLVAAWLLWKGCNKKEVVTANNSDASVVSNPANLDTADNTSFSAWPSLTVDSLSGLINYDLGKNSEFTLPGTKFTVAERGFESQLLGFIKGGTIDTLNKSANWFNMFDVQFKTGGNIYADKAAAQIKNCAAILKEYPAVKIKLGGYTDNTGSADANTKISQQRVDKIKADLIKMGVNADQISEAVGYGPLFPVCEANDTKECQARNRRITCKVAVK